MNAANQATGARSEYDRRLAFWLERIRRDERRHLLVSNLRLAAVAAAALVGVLAFRALVSPWWLVVPAFAFGALVVVHARVLDEAERAQRARRFYERGLSRLDGTWPGRGRDGVRFGEGHPCARDLDLFGRGSVFELLNLTRTETGEEILGGWLRAGAPVAEVRARQTAVDELRPKLDFREEVAVLADEAQVAQTRALIAWAASARVALSAAVTAIFVACSVATVGLALVAYQAIVPWSLVLGWLLVGGSVTFTWRRSLRSVTERVDTPLRDLSLLAGLLHRIEREPFTSRVLLQQQAGLAKSGVAASRAIGRLRQIVSLYESSTHNLLFLPVTRALLVPELLAIAINRWHAEHGPSVAEWLHAAGEVEALASLAAYAYENPADPFPSLVDDCTVFDAAALGHPLIPDASSVRNDISVGGDGPRVIIVSGSNMSGKSTLLRAVGVNVVLALAGAPVRAGRLRLSPLAIGATLRIEDSLQEGHSRFYTEILRIRDIVNFARTGKPVFFLLDEILHGTNSYDRRIGAEAIVRALVGDGAIGLVTTHDLALTELASTLPGAVNAHFEDRIEEGRMAFDYRMRPGVVEHSNALALMRAIGLDV